MHTLFKSVNLKFHCASLLSLSLSGLNKFTPEDNDKLSLEQLPGLCPRVKVISGSLFIPRRKKQHCNDHCRSLAGSLPLVHVDPDLEVPGEDLSFCLEPRASFCFLLLQAHRLLSILQESLLTVVLAKPFLDFTGFLPGRSHGQRSLEGFSPRGLRRVRLHLA